MSWVADSRPNRFIPKEIALGSYCLEKNVGPTADLGSLKKKNTPYLCRESNDSSVVHP
jgi:hypothetical protein